MASESGGDADAPVSPDAATCEECLAEVLDPADRRHRYPFTNCTNCGPRFTIVRGVPYDRPLTTMAGFEMCERCRAEYEDPADRRFHAQPNACPDCGPRARLVDAGGREIAGEGGGRDRSPGSDAVAAAARELLAGRILAVKGIGGYHLCCRADDEAAVSALRSRKHREDRPFALMAASVEAARELVELAPAEEELLGGRERPIVVARRAEGGTEVAESVAPGKPDLGVMLPYSPLHHLLAADTGVPLVMTSGNVSDEPIAFRDEDALARLGADRGRLPRPRSPDRDQDRRFGVALDRRREADAAPVARLRPGRAQPSHRRAAAAGVRRRAEEHLLPRQGPEGMGGPPHRRPRELRDPDLVHRRDRALPAHLRGRARAGGARHAPRLPLDQVRARAGGRAPPGGPAPSRPPGGLPRGARGGRAGDRRDLRRHGLRAGRDDLGWRAARGRPQRLREGGNALAGAPARWRRGDPRAVADGLRLACGRNRRNRATACRRRSRGSSNRWRGTRSANSSRRASPRRRRRAWAACSTHLPPCAACARGSPTRARRPSSWRPPPTSASAAPTRCRSSPEARARCSSTFARWSWRSATTRRRTPLWERSPPASTTRSRRPRPRRWRRRASAAGSRPPCWRAASSRTGCCWRGRIEALEPSGLRVLVPRVLPPNDGAISYGQAAVAAATAARAGA